MKTKTPSKDWELAENEWSIITSNWVQTWPQNSTEVFLTNPPAYYTKKLIDKCDIKIPPKPFADFLRFFAIERAAIVTRKSKYFVSRSNRNCYFVVFSLAVKNYKIITDSKTIVKSGQMYLIPPNKQIDTSADFINALWFEIENTPFWRKIFGNSILVKESKTITDAAFLSKMFTQELYSKNPDSDTLEALARLIIKTIIKEFENSEQKEIPNEIDLLMAKIKKSLSRDWTLQKAEKFTKLSKEKLNSAFVKKYGKTFSKKLLEMRMFAAFRSIETGSTLEETAKKVGYFDSHSLSLAFRKFFKQKPSEIKVKSQKKTL